MEVIKILNSSIVLARRGEDDKEIIVMGKGIGYRSKPGDVVGEDEIEKIYVLENETISSDLTALMKETPKEYLILADEIISHAKHTLSRHLSDHLYVCINRSPVYGHEAIQGQYDDPEPNVVGSEKVLSAGVQYRVAWPVSHSKTAWTLPA